MLSTENIVYLARKLKWSLEDIGKLTLEKAIELYNELTYQESVEDYRNQYNVALILAAIYNTIPKKSNRTYDAKDFLQSEMPTRMGEAKDSLEILAKEKGIQLPKGE